MPSPIPVVVLAGTDAVDLDVAASGILCDVEGFVALRLELDRGAGPGEPADVDTLSWAAADLAGLVARGGGSVRRDCTACCVRESVTDLLEQLHAAGRWRGCVVALPPGVEPLSLALRLSRGCSADGPLPDRFALRHVVAVVSDDPTARLLEGGPEEEGGPRTRSEILAAQVESSDTVVLARDATPTDESLLRHLARHDAGLVRGLSHLDGRELFRRGHDITRTLAHADPRTCRASGALDVADVVTVEVATWKPFHPDRLLARLEHLAMSRARCRGAFWLPGRPDVTLVLDATGGSISIGSGGDWRGRARCSRLVVTCHAAWAQELRSVLEAAVMTDAELVHGLDAWADRSDGFEAWVGRRAGDRG
ncbi:GTP-binding protein [Agilicoccus flavus]|uniref:GTP-binding protein n=1 Tax=Agilicoccus flavus TaxID=2775968 RepID=UPI001CF6A4CD|nr:GTP-binding protein [Agilicoccus flavus]